MFALVTDSHAQGHAPSCSRNTTDVLTGDSLTEPQGLNSVCDTDTGTLAVIAQANEKLAALARGTRKT